MKTPESSEPLFLGLDSSTQSLKGTLVDRQCRVRFETVISFDADLPLFQTQGGAHRHPDGLTVTSPTLVWVAALDLLLSRMKDAHAPFGRVKAVSGSGQQHGSIYWRQGARDLLRRLDPRQPLEASLASAFAMPNSPIWMDSSTGAQCRQRDDALGGPQAMADLTGSRSYERFTGNQIAKVYQIRPDVYAHTERISLVSSFLASLLIGDYAPIEPGDGAGMNLMNLQTRQWDRRALDITAPGLDDKLGTLVPSHAAVGWLHAYFVERYGFPARCRVIAFSGDNPCSLAALRLECHGDIAISLGTSDTVFGALSEPRPSATEGHIFGNPINPDGYMALICYKNGSLTREAVRDEFADRTWAHFDAALDRTPVGNGGKLAFFFKEPEITPPLLKPGMFRFNPAGQPVDRFTAEENIRAVLEGQFLSMRLHGGRIGLNATTVLATGGASVNRGLLRVMADVLGAPVFISRLPNSASLGAAYRALHGWQCAESGRFVAFAEAVKAAEPFVKVTDPIPAHHARYSDLLPRYAELERQIVGAGG